MTTTRWQDLQAAAAADLETAVGSPAAPSGPSDATPPSVFTRGTRGPQRPARPEALHSSPAGPGVTPDQITLVADHPTHPNLIRAHRGPRCLGYTIRDAYGWAIIVRRRTVGRFTPTTRWPEPEARAAAVRNLFLLASIAPRRANDPMVLASRGAR